MHVLGVAAYWKVQRASNLHLDHPSRLRSSKSRCEVVDRPPQDHVGDVSVHTPVLAIVPVDLLCILNCRGLWGIRTANPHVQLMVLFLDPCIDSDTEKRLEPEASKKDRFKSTCSHQAPHHFRTQGGTYCEHMGPTFFSCNVATRANLTT